MDMGTITKTRLTAIFKNLISLYINNMGIERLGKKDLVGLSGLQTINIQDVRLRSLDSNLFEDMRSLKTIKFLHCGLEFVSSRVLKPIFGNQLKKLIFNDCVWDHTSDVPVSVFMESIDAAFSPPLFESRFTTNRFTPAIATGKHSDLKIVGGFPGQQDTFSSHKFIVEGQSQTSSKLRLKFATQRLLKSSRLMIFNQTIRGMLNWIYTDAIQEEVDVFELYRIAEKYNIEALMRRSEIILSRISPLTVIKIMQFGCEDFHFHSHQRRSCKIHSRNFSIEANSSTSHKRCQYIGGNCQQSASARPSNSQGYRTFLWSCYLLG
jgi:hypothetical protein